MQHLEGSQRCSQPAACRQLAPAAAATSPRPVESCSSKSAAAPQHTPAPAGEELPALQSAPWHRDRAAGPGTKGAAAEEPPCASAASPAAASTPAEQLPRLPPDSPPPPLPPDSPPPPLPLESPPPPLPPYSPPPPLPADSPPPTLPPLPSSPPTTAAARAAARGAATSGNAEGGGCAAAAPQREAASTAPRAAVPLPTPKKSLVPAFLLEMWQALSPRKAQRGSRDGEAAGVAAGLSRLGVRPAAPAAPAASAAAAAAPAGTRAVDAKGSINSTAASAGTSTQQDLAKANPHQAAAGREAAAPAAPAAPVAEPAEKELEEGEILLSPASRAALVCSSANSAATAAAGAAAAPPALGLQPAGSPAALGLVCAPSRTLSSRRPSPAGRLPEERGGGGSKAKGVGNGVVAALRRTLRGKKRRSKKEKEAARRAAARERSPAELQMGSLVESMSQQAEQLQDQLAALSLATAPGGGGGDSKVAQPAVDVERQLAALSSQLSQLTLCLHSMQGASKAGAGPNPFQIALSGPPALPADDISGRHFVIFDTNVLLEHLDVVDSWWKALQGAGAEHTALLMPMAVLRELDGLKNSLRHYFSARRATTFIHARLLGSRHYRGQREDELHRGLSRRGDDGIIDCMLYFKARGAQVELCTNDRNLQLRCHNEGFAFHNHRSVCDALSRWKLWCWQQMYHTQQAQQEEQQQQQQGQAAASSGDGQVAAVTAALLPLQPGAPQPPLPQEPSAPQAPPMPQPALPPPLLPPQPAVPPPPQPLPMPQAPAPVQQPAAPPAPPRQPKQIVQAPQPPVLPRVVPGERNSFFWDVIQGNRR